MKFVETARFGSVLRVSLNRPEKLNAISMEMLESLDSIADDLNYDGEVKCVIVDSKSEKAFSVGADIKDWGRLSAVEMGQFWIRKGRAVFDKWENLPQPTIGVIKGHVLGGGLEFALTFDFRVVDGQAKLATPEAKIGAIAGWGAVERLAGIVPPGVLKRMLFTGEPLDQLQSLAYGLVDYVCDSGGAQNFAEEMADKITRNSPLSVRLSKQMANACLKGKASIALDSFAASVAAFSEDGKEGLAGFLEKRDPKFSGK